MSKKLALYSGLVVTLSILIVAPRVASASSLSPNYIYCPGSQTYSGYVYDQEGIGLGGVVIYLHDSYPFEPGASVTTTSGPDGSWSATIADDCPNSAQFYWQSDSNGPLMKTVSYSSLSTSYTLNVWRAQEDTTLAYEFANTNESTITITQSKTFTISDNVGVQGGIQDGFLGFNVAGKIGTTLTTTSTNTFSDTIPYWGYYQTGMSIKVEDTSGNYMEYKQTFTGNVGISSQSATEYLTSSQGLSNGGYYLSVAPYGTSSQTDTVSGVINVDLQVGIAVFGVTLGTEDGLSNTQETGVSWSIHNPYSYEQCFVVYQQGFTVHTWWISNSVCP